MFHTFANVCQIVTKKLKMFDKFCQVWRIIWQIWITKNQTKLWRINMKFGGIYQHIANFCSEKLLHLQIICSPGRRLRSSRRASPPRELDCWKAEPLCYDLPWISFQNLINELCNHLSRRCKKTRDMSGRGEHRRSSFRSKALHVEFQKRKRNSEMRIVHFSMIS